MFKFKYVLALLFAILCVSCTAEKKVTDEVVFSSRTGIPSDFTKGTFLWRMPKIDKDATLEYGLYLPDGKEYFQYTFKKNLEAGKPIRSDFNCDIFKGKLKKFCSPTLKIKIKVDKGSIEFVSKPNFDFIFSKKIGAVQEKHI